MSSCEPVQFTLLSNEKFNGMNWTKFEKPILAAVKSCSMLPYIDGTLQQPANPGASSTPTPTTYWGSKTPTQEEWDQRDAYVQGLIILNVKNPVGHGVRTDGTGLEMWKSLTDHFDTVTDLGLMDAKNRLCAIRYLEGSDLNAHFAGLCVRWERVNNQGGTMTDVQFCMIILGFMPKSWSTIVSTLMTTAKSSEVIVKLTMHSQLLACNTLSISTPSQSTHSHSLMTQTQTCSHQCSTDICTNPVCGQTRHTIERCFKPGGGMAGQYPSWWGRQGSGNLPNATTASNPTTANSAIVTTASPSPISPPAQYYAFMAIIHDIDASNPITSYADSAASDQCFVRRDDFLTYTPCTGHQGATATDGTFSVLGIGIVKKLAIFNGQCVNLTFKNSLYTLSLSHNLISIGQLGK